MPVASISLLFIFLLHVQSKRGKKSVAVVYLNMTKCGPKNVLQLINRDNSLNIANHIFTRRGLVSMLEFTPPFISEYINGRNDSYAGSIYEVRL